jgi:MFS family permease
MAAKRWGRQLSVFVAYLINIGGVFIQFFVMTPGGFFAGKHLNGIALGCFTTVAPTYASEVGPLPLRGALAAGMNFAIVLGQLIGYGVLREVSLNYAYTDPLSFKILISVQWGFVAVSLAILPWFPE